MLYPITPLGLRARLTSDGPPLPMPAHEVHERPELALMVLASGRWATLIRSTSG